MSTTARRGWAAAGTVAIAAAVNVATGMLTQKWALAWGIATAVLVLVGGALQAWLTVASREDGEPAGASEMIVRNVKVGRDVRMHSEGTGSARQSVTDAEVSGSIEQVHRRRPADGG